MTCTPRSNQPSRQVVKQLARLDILYVDESGYLNLKPEQSNIFFKLMEEPYRRHSTDSTARTLAHWPAHLNTAVRSRTPVC